MIALYVVCALQLVIVFVIMRVQQRKPVDPRYVYVLRHQAAGRMTEYLFASKPTAAQRLAVETVCDKSWGAQHPKTSERWNTWIEKLEVLHNAIPRVVPPGDTTNPELPSVSASATGIVG